MQGVKICQNFNALPVMYTDNAIDDSQRCKNQVFWIREVADISIGIKKKEKLRNPSMINNFAVIASNYV